MIAGRVIYLRSNAAELPLADDSVDLIVTSPPYFALRSYQDGGEHYDGQLGAEPTPGEFIDALIACTAEMRRVLKPSGSIFVNLGDKYAGAGGNNQGNIGGTKRGPRSYNKATDVPAKSLMGIPWRYALRCIDDLGLILRAEIIWAKPNGLPESVRDRVARKHEQWFHFVKSARYFSGIDEIRERYAGDRALSRRVKHSGPGAHGNAQSDRPWTLENPLGKLPGSWWTIPTEPLNVPDELGVDHYAAFPTEWPRRLVLGFSPSGICSACGEGRAPVIARATTGRDNNRGKLGAGSRVSDPAEWKRIKDANPDRIVGYACACPTPDAPTTPAVVLDPFGGTGTTAAVAKALGRIGITNDLSADYLRLAEWRCDGDGYQKIERKIARTSSPRRRTPSTTSPAIPTLFDPETV